MKSVQAGSRIGFLVVDKDRMSAEEHSAWQWLHQSLTGAALVSFEQIRLDKGSLGGLDVLWWHYDTSTLMPARATDPLVINAMLAFMRGGGGMILSLLAHPYVCDLGLESARPNVVRKGTWNEESWITDYPDIRGFGSKQGHPVFKGLEGAVFTWNPKKETPHAGAFYSSPAVPREGLIVAVERQYIKLNEERRLMTEYPVGKGVLIAIGSHFYFADHNDRFRLHLEQLATNCLEYAARPRTFAGRKTYWDFSARKVRHVQRTPAPTILAYPASRPVESELTILREDDQVRDAFFDVGGRRILIMGKEQSGVQEIWCHPFRLLRNLRVGLSLSDGSTRWLHEMKPAMRVRPESVTRVFSVGEMRIEETIATSIRLPGGVLSYRVNSNHPMDILITGAVDLRIMWPHSEQATGSLTYAWDDGLQAYVVGNESATLVGIVGLRGNLRARDAGQFSEFTMEQESLRGLPTDRVEVAFGFSVPVHEQSAELAIVVAGSENEEEAVRTYRQLAADTGLCAAQQGRYFRDLFATKTIIESPDQNFNDGYRWALAATDRFILETPSLGTSLVAGIGTTERGWDGGQSISGRPGYAWYFGRDACWTAFALLMYGDFENVRTVLQFLGDHQDLNGKILHELTTSGHVHYDAADSTPLYIMLMGRYLRASGDTDFVRDQFPRLQKAMEFCFSTDTDGDHLIENTNVGHGWVEGGKLFPVHVELYLAACWASALKEASTIAKVAGSGTLSEHWAAESVLVNKAIRERFWNDDTQFYNFALRSDGSFNAEKTVLPSVAILLGWTDPKKAEHVLEEYASSNFTADWGVRIIGKDNPMFSPQGYHYGSIWPLFTGWTALAEFVSGRYVQGLAHTLGTMMIYRHFAAGYVEEVLNGETFSQGGVCSHQAWSESMVLQPLLEGMLGLNHNLVDKTAALKPWFPPEWATAAVKNLRVGNSSFELHLKRERRKSVYVIRPRASIDITVLFQPVLPIGTRIQRIVVRSGDSERTVQSNGIDVPSIPVPLLQETTVEIDHEGGIGLVVPPVNLEEGSVSSGIRILSEKHSDHRFQIAIEGTPGETFRLCFLDPDTMAVGAEGAEIGSDSEGSFLKGRFDPSGGGLLSVKRITIHLRK